MSLADKFNLFNEFNILRIICAVFFIPHIVAKITVPATLGVLRQSRLQAPCNLDVYRGSGRNSSHHRAFLRHLHRLMSALSPSSISSSLLQQLTG